MSSSTSTSTPSPNPLIPLLPSTTLLIISTKMYFDYPQTLAYTTSLTTLFPTPKPSPTLILIPPFPSLSSCSTILQKTPHILLGAQNCHHEDRGAHTGEVSPLMLRQVGCSVVEIGHAERRKEGETNDVIMRKVKAALRNGLVPLVCVGEGGTRKNVMSEGVGYAVRECGGQVRALLEGVDRGQGVIIAYEPVWAIGAKEPASADHVLAVIGGLQNIVRQSGREGDFRFLYGGSAGPGTWNALRNGLDGLFLGRFAHDTENLKKVIEEVVQHPS